MKRTMAAFVTVCLFAMAWVLPAFAAPSISALETPKTITISTDDAQEDERIQELAEETIITSRANVEQYDAGTADIIARAEKTFEETGTNGHTISDPIPTVDEIFSDIKGQSAYDLKALKQLTYLQDFKQETTGNRIVPRGRFSNAVEVTIPGDELLKSARREDFVIIQLDLETGELYFLTMKKYDSETGAFSVDFPCFGPYMITIYA